jgi:hypothetical protein
MEASSENAFLLERVSRLERQNRCVIILLLVLNSGQRFWNIMSVLLSPGRGGSLETVLRFEGSVGPWPEVDG